MHYHDEEEEADLLDPQMNSYEGLGEKEGKEKRVKEKRKTKK